MSERTWLDMHNELTGKTDIWCEQTIRKCGSRTKASEYKLQSNRGEAFQLCITERKVSLTNRQASTSQEGKMELKTKKYSKMDAKMDANFTESLNTLCAVYNFNK